MAGHGQAKPWPWPAMASCSQSWLGKAGHGGSWPAMASRGWPVFQCQTENMANFSTVVSLSFLNPWPANLEILWVIDGQRCFRAGKRGQPRATTGSVTGTIPGTIPGVATLGLGRPSALSDVGFYLYSLGFAPSSVRCTPCCVLCPLHLYSLLLTL